MQRGALRPSTQAIHVGAIHRLSMRRGRVGAEARAPHQRLVRHVLPIAVFELDQKARRAVVVDDLALENAVPCAARWIERSEELLSLGIVGDAKLCASGAPSNFFCTARPMKARSDIWAPLAFARSRGDMPTRRDFLPPKTSHACLPASPCVYARLPGVQEHNTAPALIHAARLRSPDEPWVAKTGRARRSPTRARQTPGRPGPVARSPKRHAPDQHAPEFDRHAP